MAGLILFLLVIFLIHRVRRVTDTRTPQTLLGAGYPEDPRDMEKREKDE